jgi:hypothetical protein
VQPVCDLTQLELWEVGISGLLEAERPERWQRRRTGEPRPTGDDLLAFRTVDEVGIHGSIQCAEGAFRRIGASEVEIRAPGVIEKETQRATVIHVDEERDALIGGIGRCLPAEGVGVSLRKGFTRKIEGAGLVAKAILVHDERRQIAAENGFGSIGWHSSR